MDFCMYEVSVAKWLRSWTWNHLPITDFRIIIRGIPSSVKADSHMTIYTMLVQVKAKIK